MRIVALAVAIGLAVIPAHADPADCAPIRCRCRWLAPGESLRHRVAIDLDRASAVFLGTVDTMVDNGIDPQVARVQVARVWKGSTVPTISVALRDSRNIMDSCDLELRTGETYLVFSYRRPNGLLGATKCSGSVGRADADSTLAILGPGNAPSR